MQKVKEEALAVPEADEKSHHCYHCGQACEDILWIDQKPFCCYGCRTVFEILGANDLCKYYDLSERPGTKTQAKSDDSFEFLDREKKRFLQFESETFARVQFTVPGVHCVSCIWLLEKLRKVDDGVLRSEVNFGRKTVTVDFHPGKVKLSRIAAILAAIGYPPDLGTAATPKPPLTADNLVLRLSIAGFCFGNIMLFSFPEYLGLDTSDERLARMFSILNLILALPVLLYSAAPYFDSALRCFRQKQINIDVPIAVGLIALFGRSAYDIITTTGPGYLDSFTGLVFFLLIGRWFQSRTYESLRFDRDYTSYFPLAIHRFSNAEWQPVVIDDLRPGDRIRVRNMEVVPADSTLEAVETFVDYSFVTGESRPVLVKKDEIVFAGGRVLGVPVILSVVRESSRSNLTSIWNSETFRKSGERTYQKLIDIAARRFTWIVLGIAAVTGIYWHHADPAAVWLTLTSVLMVACPCALALAAPFTFGSMLRVFGRNQLYLKNADVIERLGAIDAVVFDKTGTLTCGEKPEVVFDGTLDDTEREIVRVMTSFSTHPISAAVSASIPRRGRPRIIDEFIEIPGKGLRARHQGREFRVGARGFAGTGDSKTAGGTQVFVSIDGVYRGCFRITSSLRKNIRGMLDRLGQRCSALLTGDSKVNATQIKTLFNPSVQVLFNQGPDDKLEFVRGLQQSGRKVLMIGDGLNDAGALQQSDVGIAVTDHAGLFTPACDGILHGSEVWKLDRFLELAAASSVILKIAFAISFFYNAIALGFAVTGHLTPLAAAIIMPISSISVVGFSSAAVSFVAKRKLK